LLLSMKVYSFVLYCWVGRMTRDVPLSADEKVASFSWRFVFMELSSCIRSGGWVLCVFGVVDSVLLDDLILVF